MMAKAVLKQSCNLLHVTIRQIRHRQFFKYLMQPFLPMAKRQGYPQRSFVSGLVPIALEDDGGRPYGDFARISSYYLSRLSAHLD